MVKLRKGSPIVVAIIALTLSGCLATTSQLEGLRNDMQQQRAEADANDSIRAVQLVEILRTLRSVTDSVSGFSTRLNRMRAESQADVRQLKIDVAGIQEITGQSQERLQQLLRAQLEQRNRQTPSSAAPAVLPGDTLTQTRSTPLPEAPGPNELFQIGRDQLTRGGNSAARSAFSDLLRRFPDSELAPDAQFYIAEAFAAEGSAAPADSAYATVVGKYPQSQRAPTALYKRGFLAQTAGRTTAARRLYNDLIRKYPDSDEAELARERLRVLG